MFRTIRLVFFFQVVSLALAATLWPGTARAQGPWAPYPYGYYRAGAASVRVLVKPKQARVYVDGYYAGIVDDFDGFSQHLRARPGAHTITLYLEGYHTVTQQLMLAPSSTYKLRYTMAKLAAGETSDPPPAPPAPPAVAGPPPAPRFPPSAGLPPRMPPPPPSSTPVQSSTFGTLVIRAQPGGADILIDGDRWSGPEGDERLLLQVSEGTHHIEVRKTGYRPFAADVPIRRGETTPLNVSLPPEGR
jgi:hypothetical protein